MSVELKYITLDRKVKEKRTKMKVERNLRSRRVAEELG